MDLTDEDLLFQLVHGSTILKQSHGDVGKDFERIISIVKKGEFVSSDEIATIRIKLKDEDCYLQRSYKHHLRIISFLDQALECAKRQREES